MTREEEIVYNAVENAGKRLKEIDRLDFAVAAIADYDNGLTQGFQDGAEWAIKKYCANEYEMVTHPQHYNKYDVEVIEMMKRIWGVQAVTTWCKLTAFKYRMRLGEKPNNSIEQDLKKELFYLDYAAKLEEENEEQEEKVLLCD